MLLDSTHFLLYKKYNYICNIYIYYEPYKTILFMRQVLKYFSIILVIFISFACSKKTPLADFEEGKMSLLTRSVSPEEFDWETTYLN